MPGRWTQLSKSQRNMRLKLMQNIEIIEELMEGYPLTTN